MSIRERFTDDPLWLMDGSAFVYRGFFANQGMTRSDGMATGALYIVARILLRIMREERPRHFVFVLDGHGKNFRHEAFPAYKANRDATPEALVQQMEPIRRFIRALGVPLEISAGCEADDCIASLAARYREQRPVVIIGADKDLRQCLHPQVMMWDPAGKNEKIITLGSFVTETGLRPEQWPDLQALVGDTSDNIPGIPGIGPKTAEKILREYPSLEAVRDHVAELAPSLQAKFADRLDDMFLYRELTRLHTVCCANLELDALRLQPVNVAEVAALLREFELPSLQRELDSMLRAGVLESDGTAGAVDGKAGVRAGKTGPAGPSGGAGSPIGDLILGKTGAPEARSLQQFSLFSPAVSASGGPTDTAGATGPASDPGGAACQSSPLHAASAPLPATVAEAPLSLTVCDDPAELAKLVVCADLPVVMLPVVLSSPHLPPEMLQPVAPSAATDSPRALLLGVNGQAVQYTGPDAPLCDWLRAAAQVVTPDVKSLWRHHPALRELPMSCWFDLGLAAYLCNPEEPDVSWTRLLARFVDSQSAPQPDSPSALAAALTIRDTLVVRLHAAQLTTLLTDMEMPLIPVLADMEAAGVCLDQQALATFLRDVQDELARLTHQVYAAAGEALSGPDSLGGASFNIRSSQQLAVLLFDRLGLPRAGKTRGGQARTDQEALEKLQGKHPIIDALLAYRKMEKMRSTYLEPLPRLMNADGRIRTTFNQTATATGRLSSSNPNLQNIPIRGDLGRRMRSCFTAAPGCQLISADYSQIELRVLAHLSQEPTLLAAFRDGEDIHARTAGLLFNRAPQDVTPDERRNAKTINFGLIYGMGPQSLAKSLGITLNEAKTFIEHYFTHLSQLKRFYDSVEHLAREQGYVVTLAGRRRQLPDMHSDSNQIRSQARRQAINTMVQGSAADIIKLAMLIVHHDQPLRDLRARLLLQVHDELLLEVPTDNAEQAAARVAALMADVRPGGVRLAVPLTADAGVGPDWGAAH